MLNPKPLNHGLLRLLAAATVADLTRFVQGFAPGVIQPCRICTCGQTRAQYRESKLPPGKSARV